MADEVEQGDGDGPVDDAAPTAEAAAAAAGPEVTATDAADADPSDAGLGEPAPEGASDVADAAPEVAPDTEPGGGPAVEAPDPDADQPAPPAGDAGATDPAAAAVERLVDATMDALTRLAADVSTVAERVAAVEAAVFSLGSTAPVLDAVTSLGSRVDEVARLGDRHNELIDKLHTENQSLRKGELTQALSPLLRDLIRFADQMDQLDATSPEPGKGDAAIASRQTIEILARAGVRAVEVSEGDPFDAAVHQGLGRRPTDDPALDGVVAVIRRGAFVGEDGRVLRPAEVEVWRYEAPVEPAPAPAVDPAPEPPAEGEPDGDADRAAAPVAVPPPADGVGSAGAEGAAAELGDDTTNDEHDNDTGGDV